MNDRVNEERRKTYKNLDVWEMGAENTANLLNTLVDSNILFKKSFKDSAQVAAQTLSENEELKKKNKEYRKLIKRIFHEASEIFYDGQSIFHIMVAVDKKMYYELIELMQNE